MLKLANLKINTIYSSNDFIYAKSGKSVVFFQWDTLRGEPNKDMQNANCVQVQNHNGAWGDINCRAKRKFVCEIPSETHQPFWDDIKESTTDLKILIRSR